MIFPKGTLFEAIGEEIKEDFGQFSVVISYNEKNQQYSSYTMNKGILKNYSHYEVERYKVLFIP